MNLLSLFQAQKKVSTDTRRITPGAIFFALKGDNFDGNEYADKALALGASYAVIDNKAYLPPNNPQYILVPNVLKALQDLAREYRRTLQIPILGITGSNGKTTTKELIASVLKTEKRIFATQGNLNNHIGVPLSLLSITADTEIAVIEMGTNQPGDIRELAEIVEPTHALITNVGRAHLEKLKGLKGVAVEKGQLFQVVKKSGGTIFLNVEDKRVSEQGKGNKNVITYGKATGDYCFRIIENSLNSLKLGIKMKGREELFNAQVSGEHNAMNITVAVAVGQTFGISLKGIKEGVFQYAPSNHRSQIIEKEHYTIWMDAYNANPSSMKATIQHIASTGKKQAWILGDMLELGVDTRHAHLEIGKYIHDYKPLVAILVGEKIHYALREVSDAKRVIYCKKYEEIPQNLSEILIQAGVELVLIKGSRGMALERLLERL